MAVQSTAALPPVPMINASSDALDFEMFDEKHNPVRVTAEPGEVIDVPGVWCVRAKLANGKERPSAIEMMAPQLKAAPKPAKPEKAEKAEPGAKASSK